MTVSRRRFILLAGGTAGAALTTGLAVGLADGLADGEESHARATGPLVVRPPSSDPSRVLVVVQLGGGNDGLNTLVPADGRYRDARPTLAVPEDELVALVGASDYALHPSLAPVTPLWERGQLAMVQAIGLPGQTRSHFEALDTWWTASADRSASGGWLGRWLDATSADASPTRAVALGGGSPALVGQQASPVIVQSPAGFDLLDPTPDSALVDAFTAMAEPDGAAGLLGRARAAIPTAVDAVDQLRDAFGGSADLFSATADLIEADLGAEVIVVNLGGFDTHANQAAQHAALLAELGSGVSALFERLEESGHAERTLLMAYSEFGRRVAENGSGGTDHGAGGLALLAGPPVSGARIVGEPDLGNLDEGDVPISVDARSLYANALTWLGGPVDEVLGGTWETYDLIADAE